MISAIQIKVYHKIIRMAVDPKSPFYGKARLKKILRLPLEEQHKIYETMSGTLKELFNDFIKVENAKNSSRSTHA